VIGGVLVGVENMSSYPTVVDVNVWPGDSWGIRVVVQDGVTGAARDLSGWSWVALFGDAELTVDDDAAASGEIEVTAAPAVTGAVAEGAVFVLTGTAPSGEVATFASGEVVFEAPAGVPERDALVRAWTIGRGPQGSDGPKGDKGDTGDVTVEAVALRAETFAARDAAVAAKDAAEAVPTTSDGIIAGRVAEVSSASAVALGAALENPAHPLAVKANAAFVGRRPNTIVYLGDSNSYLGGVRAGYPNRDSRAFWPWGESFLGRRLNVLGVAATVGDTTAAMLARVDADVIAKAPAWCHVLGGTNDVENTASSTSIANLEAILDKLDAAGIRVLIGTLYPRATWDGTSRANTDAINTWIRNLPMTRKNVVVIDYARVLTTASGVWISDGQVEGGKGLHPSRHAAALAGKEFARVVDPLIPPLDVLPIAEGDSGALKVSRFLLGGTGSTAPSDSQGVTWTGTAGTYAKVARTDGVPGNWQQITVPAGSSALMIMNYTIPAERLTEIRGSYIEVGIEYSVSGLENVAYNASSPQLAFFSNVALRNSTGFISGAAAYDHTYDDTANMYPTWDRSGVFLTPPLLVPADCTLIQAQLHMRGGGTYLVDRWTIREATQAIV
tara:strand:+ start:672 stop:2513 length:1842 start_codon:yes stop_codon:yes gene_type:complete